MQLIRFTSFSALILASASALAQDPPAEEVVLEEETPAAVPPAAAPAGSAQGSTSASLGTSGAAAGGTVAVENETPTARPNPVSRGGPDQAGKDWEFSYHGYLRAPFRVGLGSRTNRYCVPSQALGGSQPWAQGDANYNCPAEIAGGTDEQSSTTYHRPVLPDDQYVSWQYSGHQKGDWAEMFLSVGNDVVTGTLAVQGFQYTDPTWANPDAQFGIGQGWVEFNSDLGYENIKFNAKAGSFWSRYGTAGKYDAGEYDTYLFGRTHATGVTSRVDVTFIDEYTLGFEAGVGANRPNPQIYNRARFTMLGHAHAFLNWVDEMEFGLHFLHSWSSSEAPISSGDQAAAPLYGDISTDDSVPDGSLSVYGVDARFDLGTAGYLYGGVSQINAKHAYTVGPAIEVMHSFGGGQFSGGVVDNYLESPFCTPGAATLPSPGIQRGGSCSDGTGKVNNLLAQYELGLANFGLFEGGQDLKFKLFAMLNHVQAEDAAAFAGDPAAADHRQDGIIKMKFGLDTEFVALSWLGAGFRFDRLQPQSNIGEQSFMIFSPRLTFKSDFVTREQVSLIYSRYMYNQRECAFGSPADDNNGRTAPISIYGTARPDGLPGRLFCVQPPNGPSLPDGFGAHTTNNLTQNFRGAPTIRPDVNVVQVQATMWW